MRLTRLRTLAASLLVLPFATLPPAMHAQNGSDNGSTVFFQPGNLVVTVEGCGVQGGNCNNVANGNGTNNGYGDNQAAPFTLFQYQPNATASATYVNSLVLPQMSSGANVAVSGEYGSSSEAQMQRSANGQYLVVPAYGINAATFNASTSTYGGSVPAEAQSGSLTGQSYTPIARIINLVDAYGNVNSSTAVFNIFNLNNPRSAYTTDGTNFYFSGQGTGTDATSGVFYVPGFKTTTTPTAITGLDAANSSGTANQYSQNTRTVTVYNNTLYVSLDTKDGTNSTKSFLGTLGTPPSTSLYNSNAGPTQIFFYNNASTPVAAGVNGKFTLTSSETNGLNSASQINLSPAGYFFANASTLYVADTGYSKQTSATSQYGDGGLQKYINSKTDGTGTWTLAYTLASGLNLVANPNAVKANTSGTTGLLSVTGVVNGAQVYLYATNYTIADLDPTYLYGITDTLAATTNPGTAFAQLAAAPTDSNFKSVSLAPALVAGSATITTVPSGLTVTTSGTGCVPGTYPTPVTLVWTPGSACTLTTTNGQSAQGTVYAFSQWQDGTTSMTDSVTAPNASAIYTATFTSNFQPAGNIDQAIDSSTSSTTIPQSDALLVTGWVADPVDGSPLSNVKLYVNGTSIGTPKLNGSRPDVASGTGHSNYANSGFSLAVAGSTLPLGNDTVTMIAIDSNGKSTTFGPSNITVTAPSDVPAGHLDQAVDSSTSTTTITTNDALFVNGWAGDPVSGTPLKSLNVYVDGTLAGAASQGASRPDVASATGNSAYANSGFTFAEAATQIAAGTHSVTAIATNAQGASITLGPIGITVNNIAPIGNLDLAVDSGTGSTTVSKADTIYVSGWAADYRDNSGAARVQIYIDGTLAGTATLNQPRPDVANAYSKTGWSNSGFVFSVPAANLSLGNHNVTAVATDAESLTTTLGPITINVTK